MTNAEFLRNLAERLEGYLLGTGASERLEEIAKELENKQFILHWLDGKKETITGTGIKDAFTKAGYGAGAVAAVDHFETVTR